jgi:hypothetical protein
MYLHMCPIATRSKKACFGSRIYFTFTIIKKSDTQNNQNTFEIRPPCV